MGVSRGAQIDRFEEVMIFGVSKGLQGDKKLRRDRQTDRLFKEVMIQTDKQPDTRFKEVGIKRYKQRDRQTEDMRNVEDKS